MKVSVIVPVYKTEDYIERCARSLFEQTMTEGVEFLFINDSTPDHAIDILQQVIDQYPSLKDQIRLLHNEHNLGITATRKRGLAESKGEYIAWVDSDDWVDPQWMESLYSATNDGSVDVVVQNLRVHTIRKGKERVHEWKLYPQPTPQEALAMFWTERHVPRGLHFQLSRKDLITKAMQQVYDVNICEDTFALLNLFYQAKTAVWIEQAYYNYLVVENGQSLSNRNFKTQEEWQQQMLNIDRFTTTLSTSADSQKYQRTCRYIRLRWKRLFKPVFADKRSFWLKYNDSYRDICAFLGVRKWYRRIAVWLEFNVYILYRMSEHQY